MSGNQIPSLPGRKRRQMPGVCPGGRMFKLRFDWYIIAYSSKSTKNCMSAPRFSDLLSDSATDGHV